MEQEWQLVSRRQRRGKARSGSSRLRSSTSKARKPSPNGEEVVEPVDEVAAEKQTQIAQRVRAIADVLRDSLLLKDALRVVTEQFELNAVQSHKEGGDEYAGEGVREPTLVGYGLGSFCASSNAVHQLGFLVALKEALGAGKATATAEVAAGADKIQHRAEIFDPAMNKSDAAIAESLDVSVIQDNEHGRRRVARNTVFFMPHCGKTLYENVLACNWGPELNRLVIIGNSFSAYGDRVLAAQERQELLLVRVLPFLEEVPLSCGVTKAHADFARYEAAFNDLSAHRFPSDSLSRALSDASLRDRMAAVATSTAADESK
ncbi:Protein Kinase [Phytophthora cinnamomi]|uniref:Protein Kinase n=1 Tax=Phytophthora cinnamomi TaxID=4785 RepID=UPI0035593FDC|nr:Protein Kinase [Phytophthora cinnamomi]